MKKIYKIPRQLILIILIGIGLEFYAQDIPFNCDYNAYLFQYNDIYAIDLASGNSYLTKMNVTEGSINAAAYNPADGFIWGSLSSPQKSIVRIGKDFNTTTYYIDELPLSNRYIGDISANGIYYLKDGGNQYYKIDLNPESPNYSQHMETVELSRSIRIHDWAFNAVDNNLYAVEKNTNILYRINPETSVVTSLGEVPILSGLNYTYGAVYFDASGRFYVSANQTGTIYVIQNVQNLDGVAAMDSNLFAFGPASASNDGARCPSAPVPQEICDNGIDDDGDGLTDCEDPSCSGYGECDVIAAPTSGGNEGGLESNNRLSDKINLRNYNRAKFSYKFDRKKARRISKNKNYAKRTANISLQDFIPVDIIAEDDVIESTPTDLLNITNATEVFSVDYLNDQNSVASILALKTDNGVYEHTKYICDRLLGGELISVSTIIINDQPFIKSLIKNTDGTIEYVMSFSAKQTDKNAAFSIESHWNLDKYEDKASYYNFQIWSNSIDDLYRLAEEVLRLLDIAKPITDYNNSTPPTVYVKKGHYENGQLHLQIINTNITEQVTIDAGFRATETSLFENMNAQVNLNQNYITNTIVNTGHLFDIGFRIGDGINTPDDIFMSDGPWGVDDYQTDTNVTDYEVTTNYETFENNDFPIERNINLTAETGSYVSAYRALTPRFKAVDLSDYNSLNFKAKGNGSVEVTIVKSSISAWEDQFKTKIDLTNDFQDINIQLSDFKSKGHQNLILNDVVTISFTMVSESGTVETKQMNLEHLRFSKSAALSTTETTKTSLNHSIIASPNPMTTQSTILFSSENTETVTFRIYNMLGKLVHERNINANIGENTIQIDKDYLNSGLYLCKLMNGHKTYNALKLLVL